jgi:hypothetical protein
MQGGIVEAATLAPVLMAARTSSAMVGPRI